MCFRAGVLGHGLWLPLLAIAALVACVRAPNVTVVDRRTALELQAAGEYHALEMDLKRAALQMGATALTREEAGLGEGPIEEFARIYGSARSDEELVDSLLVRRCIGEALDGLLAETPNTCVGNDDPEAVASVVARANRDRRQLWSFMARMRPGVSEEDARREWRKVHLAEVVCGGQIQAQDGAWEVKRCD